MKAYALRWGTGAFSVSVQAGFWLGPTQNVVEYLLTDLFTCRLSLKDLKDMNLSYGSIRQKIRIDIQRLK